MISTVDPLSLCLSPGLTEGAGLLQDDLLNAAVGGKVMFTTTLTPGTTFVVVNWKFGAKEIFTFFESNRTAPEYEGRITFFMSTGSLELRNLALTDSGEYSVTILITEAGSQTGITRLDVYEPVSNVVVTSKPTELVEFSSSGPFRCQVFTPVSEVTSDPLTLTIYYGPENNILTISPTKEHHQEGSNIALSCSAESRPPGPVSVVSE
ncbi:Carcinoembryonic antigen-related cell adhesion molecule 1 [Dissostichus eleginoides]|uniref:Carcinoembryonic antigen-related cell adhesion molecule 1 n=1 Tax=Dissostichus eleginoides TaxID=100907 RepID=A0AAD9C957_DISEL|nr:Carcinoembryonic antigen-related cell adhesion molecule 1 [Dissostichus eleginoides]